MNIIFILIFGLGNKYIYLFLYYCPAKNLSILNYFTEGYKK